jgi:hypothetical protein
VNGPEAYREAQDLRGDAHVVWRQEGNPQAALVILADAMVAAVLALTAATLHGNVSDRVQSSQAWNEVLS